MTIKLESGKPYKLSELFSDNRKIIIPDLQRDYCWGDKTHGDSKIELVSGFIDSLFEVYNDKSKGKDIQLGMIYAYEDPKNHIQLCDGQQRLTTLFLLTGMLYMHTKDQNLKNCLISEFELEDDKEPHLQYAIRESTLYFLTDLVCEFFLNSNEGVDQIKDSSWYFSEYDLDPTIQSMINALGIIQRKLIDCNTGLNDFSKFLLNDIQLFYFDMKNRLHGEDMFVIINTTGEPLTPSENLKPRLIGSIADEKDRSEKSRIWEKWEKWFWQNKKGDEFEADQGLNQFFIWYWQIKLLQEKQWKNKAQFDLNPIQLFTTAPENTKDEGENTDIEIKEWEIYKKIETIDAYFDAYGQIIEHVLQNTNSQDVLKTIKPSTKFDAEYVRGLPINVLLPLIEFKVLYPNVDIYPFLRRLRKNHFDKTIKERNDNYVDWRHILQILEYCSQHDTPVLKFNHSDDNFKKIPNVDCKVDRWYNAEEQVKDVFTCNLEFKQRIECWEDHADFMGDISTILKIHLMDDFSTVIPVIDESAVSAFSTNHFELLDTYYNNYQKLEGLLDAKSGEEYPNLANYYRLFKILTNCNKIGGIYRTSGMHGVGFSLKNRNQLGKIECLKLYKLENHLEKIKDLTRILFSDEILNISTLSSPEQIIKGWLFLKVINAEKHKSLLSYYDGNETGIAAYTDNAKNCIFENLPFSLENCICGFAVKSGGGGGNYINYTESNNWLTPNCLNTPFAGIFYNIYEKKNEIEHTITQKVVEENKTYILNLLKDYGITINNALNISDFQLSGVI